MRGSERGERQEAKGKRRRKGDKGKEAKGKRAKGKRRRVYEGEVRRQR